MYFITVSEHEEYCLGPYTTQKEAEAKAKEQFDTDPDIDWVKVVWFIAEYRRTSVPKITRHTKSIEQEESVQRRGS